MGYKDPEWLREKYHKEGMVLTDMADMEGVSKATIIRWMDKHDIPRRDTGFAQASGKYKDEGWLRQKYLNEERSMADIAGEFDVSKETVKYWIEKYDIPKRDFSQAAELRAKQHPNTIPDNEKLHPTFYRRRGYSVVSDAGNDCHVELHRLLATTLVDDIEELNGKHVHHKNGIRWDNRPENLEILTPSEHTTEHWENGDMG